MDESIILEYAIITVDLAEGGFSDYGVDWPEMQGLAEYHCTQQVACTSTLLPNERIDLGLNSPKVYTFISVSYTHLRAHET